MSAAATGAGGDAESAGGPVDPLARAVFAALIVACFVAFFLTQRLKHTPTVVQRFQLTSNFAPTPKGRHKLEQISFKVSHTERVTVAVIDSRGNVVATLLSAYPLQRYKQLSLRWNGRRGTALGVRSGQTATGRVFLLPQTAGRPAAAGEYRVRLMLGSQHKTVLSPRSFTLVRG